MSQHEHLAHTATDPAASRKLTAGSLLAETDSLSSWR